jgi:streptomycin 6-kinase
VLIHELLTEAIAATWTSLSAHWYNPDRGKIETTQQEFATVAIPSGRVASLIGASVG